MAKIAITNDAGTVTLTAGKTGHTVRGLNFLPTLSGTGSTAEVTSIYSKPVFVNTTTGVHTILSGINLDGVTYSGSVGTFTGAQGIRVGNYGHASNTTGYGVKVEAQTKGTSATVCAPFYDAGSTASGDVVGNVFKTNTQFASTTMAFGGGAGVLGIANASTAPTSNPSGGVVFASVGAQLIQRGLMSVNEPIHSTLAALAAGTAYASSNTEAALNNALFNVPANALVAGAVLRITARGVYSDTLTPTFQMRVRWGGVAGVLLGDSGALTMGVSQTNLGWSVSFIIRVVSIGASGTFECQGEFDAETTSVLSSVTMMVNAAVITVDTTAAKDLVLTGTWSANSASNTLTVRQFIVERIA